mgnify:CR=1 FL=1
MNEVKKCSLSGVAFTMDVEAYETLSAYLESLKKTYKDSPDGAEIVADIEARIAELILSAQDNTKVVEKPLILNIIRQMGSAEDISEESADGSERREEPRIPRRLYRDTENAKLGGVCAGIGRYFDIDPRVGAVGNVPAADPLLLRSGALPALDRPDDGQPVRYLRARP